MKNIIIILMVVVISSCVETPREKYLSEKIELLQKEIDKLQSEKNIAVEIVSPVIDLPIAPSRNVPSYIDPKKYVIARTNNGYAVLLPGGSYVDTYNTIVDAQVRINELAERSEKRWMESGGVDF